MNVTVTLLLLAGLTTFAFADPIPANLDEATAGLIKMMRDKFNSTGCAGQCIQKGVCPAADDAPTDENMIQDCTECIVNCAPETACYTARGFTSQQVIDNIAGVFKAIHIDGCRLGDVTQVCPKPPTSMKVLAAFYKPTQRCVDPAQMPPPPINDQDKTQFCQHLKCAYKAISESENCKRAADGMYATSTMMSTWLRCKV